MPVFRTADLALLPLAKLALEGEQIEYLVRGPGAGDEWMYATRTSSTATSGWIELVVSPADAARARDLLIDLEQPAPGAPATSPEPAPAAHKDLLEPPTITLQDVETSLPIGQISESQLQFLIDHLEEDPDFEQDYYVDGATVELLATAGADAGLVDLLKRSVGGRDGLQIRWRRYGEHC